ncbi:ABLIM3 [Cordylochernes scorpioides]|uniref:ABLIM3 n=1 Tax=Cordylochernes scorpioides TaxID=51811 RepID=A0ABY6K4E2_9ARAC|nr:ABLIM3 [Cordylochernes scorpioides]
MCGWAACQASLAQGGFFSKDGSYYCTADYQRKFGTKCKECNQFVEGEVVTARGHTYHHKCFVCERCRWVFVSRQPFPTGEKVTFTGKECLCQKCIHIPVVPSSKLPEAEVVADGSQSCAGCKEELKEGQALIALDQQWHIWCFKCVTCEGVLHGEYMGKYVVNFLQLVHLSQGANRDGLPYCEKDYEKQFGVKCDHCERFISGKVLQVTNYKLVDVGEAIWHPRCGPMPEESLDDGDLSKEELLDGQVELEPSLTPPLSTQTLDVQSSYGRCSPFDKDLSRVYTCSYLTMAEPTQGYLRRPVHPYPPKSPQFHRPPGNSCCHQSYV